MGLPKAVQEMQDKTTRIQSDLQQQSQEGKTGDNAVPASNNSNPKSESKDTGNNKSQTVSREEFDALDKRYRAYKKMYDKEVHGFRTTLADKDAEIEKLKGEVESLKKSVESASSSSGDDDFDDENLDAIRSEFGPQFVDAVGNLSRSQLMRENGKLVSRIEKLEQAIGSGKQAQSQSRGETETATDKSVTGQAFFSRLTELVPDWKNVNGTQGFSDFLDLPDEDGTRRQDNLSRAQRNGNVIEVARHFLDYADFQQSHRTGTSGDYLPDDKTGGGSDLGFDDDAIIYEDELEEYYRDVALRKFSDEEIARYEAKISHAMENGLIRPRPRR